jgi:hypothetical protein
MSSSGASPGPRRRSRRGGPARRLKTNITGTSRGWRHGGGDTTWQHGLLCHQGRSTPRGHGLSLCGQAAPCDVGRLLSHGAPPGPDPPAVLRIPLRSRRGHQGSHGSYHITIVPRRRTSTSGTSRSLRSVARAAAAAVTFGLRRLGAPGSQVRSNRPLLPAMPPPPGAGGN